MTGHRGTYIHIGAKSFALRFPVVYGALAAVLKGEERWHIESMRGSEVTLAKGIVAPGKLGALLKTDGRTTHRMTWGKQHQLAGGERIGVRSLDLNSNSVVLRLERAPTPKVAWEVAQFQTQTTPTDDSEFYNLRGALRTINQYKLRLGEELSLSVKDDGTLSIRRVTIVEV